MKSLLTEGYKVTQSDYYIYINGKQIGGSDSLGKVWWFHNYIGDLFPRVKATVIKSSFKNRAKVANPKGYMLDTTNNFLQELDNPTVDKYKFTFKNSNTYKNSVNIYVNGILVAQKHNSQADYGRASGRGNGSRLSQGSKTMMSVHWVMSGLKKLNPNIKPQRDWRVVTPMTRQQLVKYIRGLLTN